jgi:hypothetical protein
MTMPAPPPDTRAPGQTGHIADHNAISDAVAALESAVTTLENTVDGVGISLPAGDLGGTAAAPEVVKIQGTPINAPPGGTTAYLRADGTWDVPPGTGGGGGGGGGGDGTVTSVSGETANGFVVSVNEETTTPQVTVGTSVAGLAKGASGALVAAVAGTDYLAPNGSGAGLTGITVGQVAGAISTESPTFTGEPSAPTAPPGTNTTQLATTAFAGTAASSAQNAAEAASLPLPSGGSYPGGTTAYLRADGTWDVPSSYSNPMSGVGDTTYGGSSGALTRLAANTTATKKFYTETGTGTAGAAPAWSTIAVGDVPTLNQSTTGNAATATTAAACSGNASTATNLEGPATVPAQFAPTVVPLSFGASIAVNGLLGNVFDLTLTASTGTLANPTGMVNGQPVRVRIRQGGAGGYTLAYGSQWDFGAAGAPTLSDYEGACDYVVGEWDSVKSKVNVSSALGY